MSNEVGLTVLGGFIAGGVGLAVNTFDRWRQRLHEHARRRRETLTNLEETLVPLELAIAQAIPNRDPMTKIVGRVHEIPELDTWVLREPDDRPWEDADRWRRVEDAAAEVERRWRGLRIRLRAPNDASLVAHYRLVKEAAISLTTGAVGAVERAELS